jgi:antibiotic biosynthesis monooxygenase (ABM) superfamily enzyme
MQEPLAVLPAGQPITVNIVRTVRPGSEQDFEAVLRSFIPKALTFPGHLGVHVVKPAARTSRNYHVVIKFTTAEQWQSFRSWAEYEQFRTTIEPLLEREPCVEEMTGLESWLTLPHAPALRPLPRWKMALVTLLGVYPTSLIITVLVRPRVAYWPLWLQSLAFAVCMVGMLTWVVMPLLTRLLAPWLYSRVPEESPNSRSERREREVRST